MTTTTIPIPPPMLPKQINKNPLFIREDLAERVKVTGYGVDTITRCCSVDTIIDGKIVCRGGLLHSQSYQKLLAELLCEQNISATAEEIRILFDRYRHPDLSSAIDENSRRIERMRQYRYKAILHKIQATRNQETFLFYDPETHPALLEFFKDHEDVFVMSHDAASTKHHALMRKKTDDSQLYPRNACLVVSELSHRPLQFSDFQRTHKSKEPDPRRRHRDINLKFWHEREDQANILIVSGINKIEKRSITFELPNTATQIDIDAFKSMALKFGAVIRNQA